MLFNSKLSYFKSFFSFERFVFKLKSSLCLSLLSLVIFLLWAILNFYIKFIFLIIILLLFLLLLVLFVFNFEFLTEFFWIIFDFLCFILLVKYYNRRFFLFGGLYLLFIILLLKLFTFLLNLLFNKRTFVLALLLI